jgi:hypothetical protein
MTVNDFLGPVKALVTDRHKQVNLKMLNFFLLACVAALAVRLGFIIDGSYKKLRTIDFRITAEAPGELREKSVMKKLDYYLDRVRVRDIFTMGATARLDETEAAGPSAKATEAVQNLRLVGISWSDDPDAMIEDIKALKTFFVKRGQSFGDVKVEAITKEKVILRYGQELIDLR